MSVGVAIFVVVCVVFVLAVFVAVIEDEGRHW